LPKSKTGSDWLNHPGAVSWRRAEGRAIAPAAHQRIDAARRQIYWLSDAIKRAAMAERENFSNDVFRPARNCIGKCGQDPGRSGELVARRTAETINAAPIHRRRRAISAPHTDLRFDVAVRPRRIRRALTQSGLTRILCL
jgi:hypothetical protein